MFVKELSTKSKDTEETFDKIVVRPLGYLITLVARKLGITPNFLTASSIILGVIAGCLLFYQSLEVNLIGVLLLFVSDLFDSSDGQLARLTNKTTQLGRILDGFGGDLIFASVYISFGLRLSLSGSHWAVWVLIVIAAISHILQASIADYYRNIYLYYVSGKEKSELETSEEILSKIKSLRNKSGWFEKLFLRLYYSYTTTQESLSKSFQKYHKYIKNNFTEIPDSIRQQYRLTFKPMIKYYNLMTINSRYFMIFVSVIFNSPLIFVYYEIIILNIAFLYVLIIHNVKFNSLLNLKVIADNE